jgi:hypothetical protein
MSATKQSGISSSLNIGFQLEEDACSKVTHLVKFVFTSLGIEYGGLVSIVEEVPGCHETISPCSVISAGQDKRYKNGASITYHCYQDHMQRGCDGLYSTGERDKLESCQGCD